MRVLVPLGALALLAACSTSSSSEITMIDSQPQGALVQIAGFGECDTPCSVKVSSPKSVVVAKAGYLPQRFQISPGDDDINLMLELAAPTNDVDTETLPSIN